MNTKKEVNQFEVLQGLEQKPKDRLIDDIIYHCEHIDFETFDLISIEEMHLNFIQSEKFLELCEIRRKQFFENYRYLMSLSRLIEQFQKENKIYAYYE